MAIGGAIVGLIGVVRPEVWGSGFAGTNRILRGNPSLPFLAELFVAKIAATAATIGSGGVGGVFTPALMTGASLGGVVAKLTEIVFPWIDSPVGGYALLGMGGLLAGVTRAPLLAIIMIFELTQNTAVLLPMMAVSVLAVLSARALQKDSMYIQSLRSAGIVWDKTPEATALSSLKVSDVMRDDVKLVPRNMTLPEIVNVFLHTRSLYLYVGDDEGRLLGVVDLHDIKESLPERNISSLVIAEDLAFRNPVRDADGTADERQREALVPRPGTAAGRRDRREQAIPRASSRAATSSVRSTARCSRPTDSSPASRSSARAEPRWTTSSFPRSTA